MKKTFIFSSVFFILFSVQAQEFVPFHVYESEFTRFLIRQQTLTLSGSELEITVNLRDRHLQVNEKIYHLKREGVMLYALDEGGVYHAILDLHIPKAEGKEYKVKGRRLLDLEGNKVGDARYELLKAGKSSLSISLNQDVPDLVLAMYFIRLMDRLQFGGDSMFAF